MDTNEKASSNTNRDKYYGVSPSQYIDIINHIMKANPEEVKATISKIKTLKEGAYNKYSATKDMSQRHLATIPESIYYYFQSKYPGFWSNKKNVDKFLEVFNHFVIPEKL